MRRERRSGWQFSFKVLIPVIVAVVVTAGTAAAFVLWSASKSDDRALQRQTRLVGHILSQERDYIAGAEQGATGWDDAVVALRDRDLEWVDENLGRGIYDTYAHNRIYVLDHALKPIYALRDGGTAPAQTSRPIALRSYRCWKSCVASMAMPQSVPTTMALPTAYRARPISARSMAARR